MTFGINRFSTDHYKHTVGGVFYHWNKVLNMNVQAEYMFVDRDNRQYPAGFADRLWEKFIENSELPPKPDIAAYYTDQCRYVSPEYINWYDNVFYFDHNQIELSQKGGGLRIFYRGPIHTVNHHEIISLRRISDLITEMFGYKPNYGWQDPIHHLLKTIKQKGVTSSHGGGRRALSRDHHNDVLGIATKHKKGVGDKGGFYGESFVDMAWAHGLPFMGTMGHEFIEACAGIWGVENANRKAREIWHDFYGKNVGYWLDDTYGSDWSDKEITREEVQRLKGFRQDSKEFDVYVDDKIALLERLQVPNADKHIISSEGLNSIEDIVHTVEYKPGNFERSSLLGKILSNNSCDTGPDRFGRRSMGYNIVNKLVRIKVGNGEWKDVCKLSDQPSKAVGSQKAIAEARAAHDLAMSHKD